VVGNPGDTVTGDHDGVVVIPQSEAVETLHRVPHQEDVERQIRDRVKAAAAT